MREALSWLGLDWDGESLQSEHRSAHEAALDRLAEQGLLYPCACSRSRIQRAGTRAADGGWRYPGTCREHPLTDAARRAPDVALRLRLAAGRIALRDESGLELSQDPLAEMGDPVLRRKDGAVAYHLAVVVDDADQAIGRIVRGRDLAPSTALHVTLQRRLGLPTPVYRHHALLLEETGGKLAKLHGAVGFDELRASYTPERLCGLLAAVSGLRDAAEPVTPRALLDDFDWARVRASDRVVRWSGRELLDLGPGPSAPAPEPRGGCD